MTDTVYVKHEGEIAWLILNKPERKNALDGRMMDLLRENLTALEENEATRVIILRGEGEVFSAGGDMRQNAGAPLRPEQSRRLLQKYLRAMEAVRRIDKPVLAMVEGYAIGGAMSLALACDLVTASEQAFFWPNFVLLGIVPELGLMAFLPRLLGAQRAKEILFTGRRLSAAEGWRLGFVNRVLPGPELAAGTLALAREVAAVSPLSLQLTKSIINRSAAPELDMVTEAESVASPFCTQTEAYREALARFSAGKKGG
ncbi:MAG: enoyl-CoA hydratase/isomerase family protein [Gracilibacteraceae bacterium]|jgi:2-(1,2-epoxy-1,2-dihydrophenyl)acetyl-CoA isomerase|nr:enoyl-CoA hydratase/isomerase family protein [Gracilibacteraceae bacterium]